MKYKIHRAVIREGQYEILYDVMDDAGKLIVGNLIRPIGKRVLNKLELDDLFSNTVFPEITEMLTAPVPEPDMTREEVKQLLVEKGYLDPGQTIEELPTKTQLLKQVKVL